MGRGRPAKCIYCGATSSVAKGFRHNKSGKVRLRRCKACGRRWTVGPARDEKPPETEQPKMPDLTDDPATPDQEPFGCEPHRTNLPQNGEEIVGHEPSGEENREESEATLPSQ